MLLEFSKWQLESYGTAVVKLLELSNYAVVFALASQQTQARLRAVGAVVLAPTILRCRRLEMGAVPIRIIRDAARASRIRLRGRAFGATAAAKACTMQFQPAADNPHTTARASTFHA